MCCRSFFDLQFLITPLVSSNLFGYHIELQLVDNTRMIKMPKNKINAIHINVKLVLKLSSTFLLKIYPENLQINLVLCFVKAMVFNATLNNVCSYIEAATFIGKGDRST